MDYEESLEFIFAKEYLEKNIEFKNGERRSYYSSNKYPSIEMRVDDAFLNDNIPEINDNSSWEQMSYEIWDCINCDIENFKHEHGGELVFSECGYEIMLKTGLYDLLEEREMYINELKELNEDESAHREDMMSTIDELKHNEGEILDCMKEVIAFKEYASMMKRYIESFFDDHILIYNKDEEETKFVSKYEFEDFFKDEGWTKHNEKRLKNACIHT